MNDEQGEASRVSASREEPQGNETLDDGRDMTVRAQPQEEFEGTAP